MFSCPSDFEVIHEPEIGHCSTDCSWLRLCYPLFHQTGWSLCYTHPILCANHSIISTGCILLMYIYTHPHSIVILFHLITSWYFALVMHVICLLLYSCFRKALWLSGKLVMYTQLINICSTPLSSYFTGFLQISHTI
jgi:hypothetical protein